MHLLRYRSVQKAESERHVDQYGVVYYGGRWFLAGYCHLRQDLRYGPETAFPVKRSRPRSEAEQGGCRRLVPNPLAP